MNTKGIKFLAVLAVLAMAFAAVAVITDAQQSDAKSYGTEDWTVVPAVMVNHTSSEIVVPHPETYTVSTTGSGTPTDPIKVTVTAVDIPMHKNGASNDGAWIGFGVVLKGGEGITIKADETNSSWAGTTGPDNTVDITYLSDVAGTDKKGTQDGVSFYKNAALMNGQTFYYKVAYDYSDTSIPDVEKCYQVTYNLSYSSDAAAVEAEYYAKLTIGSNVTYYPTLKAAVDKVHETADQTATITLLGDLSGDGIAIGYNTLSQTGNKITTSGEKHENITIDFNTHTYTVNGATVGSSGTETQGFQFLKGSTVVLKNGAINAVTASAAGSLKRLVANYSDLTITDMVITSDVERGIAYLAGNNSIGGKTSINHTGANYAIDIDKYASYAEPTVAINIDGTIKGFIWYENGGTTTEQKISLNITKGNFEGNATEGVLKIEDTAAAFDLNINGGSFGHVDVLPYVTKSSTVTITDNCSYIGNIALADGVAINVDEAAAIAVTGNVTCSTTAPATITLAKGASFTATSFTPQLVIKTAGSDQPVDVETETGGKIGDKDVADYINDNQTAGTVEATVVTVNTDAIKNKPITVEKADVTFVAGAQTSLTDVSIVVKATETSSNAVTFTGFTSGVSGTVTTTDGTNTQTIVLNAVKGTFTISRGSVIIDDAVITGGSFTISNGVEVKISGSIDTSTFTINMISTAKATDKATVTVVKAEGKDLEITNGATFVIDDSRITLKIDGKLYTPSGKTGTLETKGDVIVNGELSVTTVKDVVGNDVTITANAKSKVTGTVTLVADESKFIAYSGSNINKINKLSTLGKFVGMDSDGGKWTFTSPTLKLESYNGTYNFGAFAADITSIVLVGDSSISYAFTDKHDDSKTLAPLFGKTDGGITAISTKSSGSLEIKVDISKVEKDQLFATNRLIVMVVNPDAGSQVLNGVSLKIVVSGENSTWTTKETEKMLVTGIYSRGEFNTFNANVALDIVSAYTSKTDTNVYGIFMATDLKDISIDSATAFSVKSAGIAINATKKVSILGSLAVELDGKKIGLSGGKDLDIKSTASVAITGADVAALTVRESSVTISGTANVAGNITETNSSMISFTGTATLGGAKITIEQASTLAIKNGTINSALTNDAYLNISGNVVVSDGKSITNNATMTNTGVIGVYGDFTNYGTFTNDGTFEMLKFKYVTELKTFTITDVRPTATGNVRVHEINLIADAGLKKVTPAADGTAKVYATIDFQGVSTGDDIAGVAFSGILTPAYDGGYKLVLTNDDKTATVTLTYTKVASEEVKLGGKSYNLAVTGTVKNASDDVYYLATYGPEASKSTDTVKEKFTASTGTYTDDADSVTINSKDFILSSKDAVTLNGGFTGNLVSNVTTTTTLNGVILGDVTANESAVTLNAKKSVVGNITAKGLVTIDGTVGGNIKTDAGVTASGTIVGDITAKGNVVVTDLLGNITVDANGELTVNVKGDMDGTITYISKYKATKDAKEGEETTYTAKIDVDGETKDGGFIIILAAGADATASTAVVPGYFKINSTMADLATGKIVEISLTEGKLLVDSVIKMKAGYYLNIEAGTTIEVNKSAASLDVTEAALKVSKEATANFETGSATPVNYGKVLYIMSFTIDDAAYTIYSDVAYALSNCDEGSELTVGANAPINTNVSVPAGVNIIVDSVTLTFSGMDVEMGEGAKITLMGTGKLVFNAAKDNKAIVKEDEEWEFYSVTATVVSGDNEIGLYGVRFNADNNVIMTKAETATEPAKLDVDFKYNEGAISIVEGNAIGDLKLANYEYEMTKAATEKTKVTAIFTVAEGAVFELESFSDEMMAAEIVSDDVVITSLPTIFAPNGTVKVLNNITVNGSVIGEGSMILADDKTITIAFGEYLDYKKGLYYGPVFSASVFDANLNGFDMEAVAAQPHNTGAVPADPEDPAVPGVTFAIKADKTNECITFVGTMFYGKIDSITATSAALFDGVVIADDAVFEAEDVTIKGTTNAANGLLKVVELEKKTGATIAYGATYTEGDYTVYTIFKNIDFDVVSELTLTQDLELSKVTESNKVDLSGMDVNITIAEGKKLVVDKIFIIGTPITVLGDEGSSIVGKVVIKDGSYLVAYADVDLTFAEILGNDAKTDAVFSKLDVEDMPYAVIFASNQGAAATDIVLAKADAALIPEIVGYNFTAWLNYNGDAKALVGETNAYADAKEVYVTVVVKYVAGVDYYMNGIIFNVYDIPTDVAYGSYFTAKISDTTKYQGNPLINGQKTVCVDDDMELVASGVTPIPEPEPEPVVGDSGLSLTDILLIVLVILIAIMVVILVLRLNRS